jgi:hypothetical protein
VENIVKVTERVPFFETHINLLSAQVGSKLTITPTMVIGRYTQISSLFCLFFIR